MNKWEVFVDDVGDLTKSEETELTIRTLNPGRSKYTYIRARAKVSPDLEKYPDRLQVRLGRGQLSPAAFSVEVVEEVPRLPEKYR